MINIHELAFKAAVTFAPVFEDKNWQWYLEQEDGTFTKRVPSAYEIYDSILSRLKRFVETPNDIVSSSSGRILILKEFGEYQELEDIIVCLEVRND